MFRANGLGAGVAAPLRGRAAGDPALKALPYG
jgi:hypothetical protein